MGSHNPCCSQRERDSAKMVDRVARVGVGRRPVLVVLVEAFRVAVGGGPEVTEGGAADLATLADLAVLVLILLGLVSLSLR